MSPAASDGASRRGEPDRAGSWPRKVGLRNGRGLQVTESSRREIMVHQVWTKVVDFHTFDAEYVRRLAEGDPETESHFSIYFGRMLSLKLRSRRISPAAADDVRQETLFRVLKTLRHGAGVSQPERFGAFVNSVCNNVLLELHNKSARDWSGDSPPDIPDQRIDTDASLITAERRRLVRAVLNELSAKDRDILRLIFFEEVDRDQICRTLGVDADYLRVLLHRAKAKFQTAFKRREHGKIASALLFVCNELVSALTI